MTNCTKKNVYIIGHRNPDTDSVVSAVGGIAVLLGSYMIMAAVNAFLAKKQ